MPSQISDWVSRLGLQPHPEGGFYRQTYRSPKSFPPTADGQFPSLRPLSTAILYLLPGSTFSAFHRIRSDEVWHFHAGTDLMIYVLTEQGHQSLHMGLDMASAAQPQVVVPAGCWFAAKVIDPDSFTLASCTVSPGFEYADFELANRADLCRLYPSQQALIRSLTRE